MVRPTEIRIVRHVQFKELERIVVECEGKDMSQATAEGL